MRVGQLPDVDAEQIARLQAAGISNSRQLLRASQRRERFLELVDATGLSQRALEEVVRRAEVSLIRGIGSATLSDLLRAGVDSLEGLALREPETLRAELYRVTTRVPNLAVVEDWISQARQLTGLPLASSLEAGPKP
jgi:hypothetical protein